MEEPPFPSDPREMWRPSARSERRRSHCIVATISLGLAAAVGGFVIVADTRPLMPLIGRAHWGRLPFAIGLAAVSVLFMLAAGAKFEWLRRVSVGLDLAASVVADSATGAELSGGQNAVLRPAAIEYAAALVTLASAAVISDTLAAIAALAILTWLSFVTPFSLTHAWARERAFFGPRSTKHPIRSVVIAVISSLSWASALLAIAWRIDHAGDARIVFLDELVLVAVAAPVLATMIQPVVIAFRWGRESVELVAVRCTLLILSCGGTVASLVLLDEARDPFWRDAVVSGLQGAAVAVFVTPPILTVREPFARREMFARREH